MSNYTKSIAVCMSTYNGEKYIREQIDSILRQDYKNLYLLIRDDGSTDTTCDIIQEYTLKNENVVFINTENRENVRPTKSFFLLLRYAFADPHAFDYYSFADQDDVWLPDKISRAVNILEEASESKYGKLYFSRKTVVDQNMNPLYEEDFEYYNDYFETVCPNLASGCTMVLDRTLVGYLIRHIPEAKWYHDAWAYRAGKTLGCTIVCDSQSGILYRRHEKTVTNLVRPETAETHLRTLSLASIIRSLLCSESDHYILYEMNDICDVFEPEMIENGDAELCYCFRNYRNHLIARLKLLGIMYKRGLGKRNIATQSLWSYKIIRKRI